MFRLRIVTIIILAFLITSCSSQPESASGGPTPTPLPTTTAPQFPVVAAQACQLTRFPALRTRYPQGDLIAWSPDSSRLAYVGPAENSNWFAGKLHIIAAPDFSAITDPDSDILTFGDLTWSPDGSQLAYVLFRQPDAYSVGVTDSDNSTPVDLLTAADPRTDIWSSSKIIQQWRSPKLLRVLSSCGDDCDQTYEIDLQTGQIASIGEQLRKAPDRLWPEPDEREYDETLFPVMWQPTWDTRLSPQMKRPTWTQDGNKVAYIDRFIVAWVLHLDLKEQYALDTPYVDVQELKWSPDNRYLALRTDDDIYVYDTECQP